MLSKNPRTEPFVILKKHLIDKYQAACILGLSETAKENWRYAGCSPSKSNYDRLRLLCYLVTNPNMICILANNLYRDKDKIRRSLSAMVPFSALSMSVDKGNELQCLNIIIHAYEGKEDKIPYGIKYIIEETRRKLIRSISILHKKQGGSGRFKDYSLELLKEIDKSGGNIEIPDDFKIKVIDTKKVKVA